MSDAQRGLVRALLARAHPDAALLRAERWRWASSTFEGERHVVTLALPAAAAPGFLADIAEAEFALPRHLVADLIATADPVEAGETRITIEALTLLDG